MDGLLNKKSEVSLATDGCRIVLHVTSTWDML
jgi:hypothetical protein